MRRLIFLSAVVMMACGGHENVTATYKPYHTLFAPDDDVRRQQLVAAFEKLDAPSLPATATFDSGWVYLQGEPKEGLQTDCKKVDGVGVNLPHRLTLPNTPMWYAKAIDLSAPGVLTIRADDGAQLYINGKLIPRLHNNDFPVDTVGHLAITIRVLNNAMAGGLRHVSFSTSEQYKLFNEQSALHIRRKRLMEKVRLLAEPVEGVSEKMETAILQNDDASWAAAEAILKPYPYFTGPWLQWNDAKRMTVSLELDGDLPVELRLQLKGDRWQGPMIQKGKKVSFVLENLLPDTAYSYTLTSGKTQSPLFTFRTPSADRPFSFNVWADSQSGIENFQQNVSNLSGYGDAFGVGVGDLVSNGATSEEWRMFFNVLGASSAERPYFLVPGNHDYDGYYDDLQPEQYKHYLPHTPQNYFSWRYGPCAFIALDPNERFPIDVPASSRQYQWFREQLESDMWKTATWHFVFLHQPPYSQGWAGYEGDETIRQLLEPFIESSAIDFVVAGHTHDYERLTKMYGRQQTTFLIVGGAGGSLEPAESSATPQMDTVLKVHHMGRFYIAGSSLRFEAIDISKKVVDSFQRTK
ncbi:Calcineurin-like phosphoesterase [Chryseolinea serpens]|uniref:Calcineurin-like phosphoesterase n=1 Tax=Chryseolinea serpens TaxID=947013 RepID=A0A1M5SHC8_9BACT|nr:metallophosphoesterase [Chryseolinea serpens]SHH37810.1 Calcineurin-like phosphoesterase [Chryseolinea serpens]